MYWIVESKDQLKLFKNSGFKEAYVDIIGVDPNVHPAEDSISLVYIRPIKGTKGYVLPVRHTEALEVNEKEVYEILLGFQKVYCTDKKRLWHYYHLPNLFDIIHPPRSFELSKTTTHQIFHKRYPSLQQINRIIPIVKHYQRLEKDYDKIRDLLTEDPTEYAKYYNDRASVVYHNIEKSGIGINTELFFKHFYNRKKPYVYNQYNLNTSTTRPSNKFGGVNYAALNKKTGERSCFIPQNDYFVEFDVKAYHPVIVSHLIGYDFDNADVHQSFADMYGVDRERAKEITFQQFYGKVFAKYKDLSYFKLLSAKQDELVSEFHNKGFVEVPGSKYRFTKNTLGDINKEKLFNYYLQATESSYNVDILEKIQKILDGSESKIVLTVYDSFLFDMKKGEENLLNEVQNVFKNKRLNTSIKSGYDYNFT